MGTMKSPASATVIGDVVGSRGAGDRAELHRRLTVAVDRVNEETGPLQPLRVTVGDEFQGAWATLGDALSAAFAVRLALLPDVDSRYGVGWGPVTALDETTQDGPGWWAAREAIVEAKREESRAATSTTRTLYRTEEVDAPTPEAVNAALRCRDHMVGSLDGRSVRILRALMSGATQAGVAEAEGISPSAVSQRVRSGGLGVLVLAAEDLGRLP